MGIAVTGLATTAVKAMRLREVEQIDLGELGAVGNRSFCVIDERGRMVNGKRFGELQTIVPDYDHAGGELALTFPDGSGARGRIEYGNTLKMRFFSRPCEARELRGPWAEALSSFIGHPLRLVEPELAVDRGREGTVSVISRASIQRLAEVASVESIDVRRFRMLIEIDGVAPHEEDHWVGHKVRIGLALVAVHGNVGRCLVTSRDADTGTIDLPTLDLLGSYRNGVRSTEPLPFGIYGEVLEPGIVRVGDAVALDG
jgi:uncharacterized protein YcbX